MSPPGWARSTLWWDAYKVDAKDSRPVPSARSRRDGELNADLLIADIVGLPRGLPFIAFTNQTGWTAKLPDVDRYVGDRAVAWVDDQLGPDVQAWAASRMSPTLLVATDHRVGLTADHIDQLWAFAAALR